MDFVSLLYVMSFIIPQLLFVLGRKLLDNKKYFYYLLLFFSLIALVGIIIAFIGFQKDYSYLILIIPAISLLFYQFLIDWFKRKFDRPPIDTFMYWREGLFWDRAFNIGYLTFGILIPFSIIIITIETLK
jgi:hypothetical protein